MDFGTIIGILGGFSLVFLAIASGGGLGWFVDAPSAMIVVGGTFGAVLINYPMSDFLGVIRVAKNVFFQRRRKTAEITKFIVQMSRVARREGVFSLQKMAGKMKDPFFDKAVELMVDGIEPVDMRRILETELEAIADRHRLGAEIFTTMGNFAPAMGMMGTLIGLVQMMMQMNNPSAIGPAMAVALITTFYGVILANLVFLPIAGKLRKRSAEERLEKRLIIDGILSIQSGDNPRVVEQKLHSFVSPHERKSVFHQE